MSEANLPIRTVAERTGVPVNTIRTWERRHRLISPSRTSGGERRYSAEDVERVGLIRRATSAGFALADLVGQPNAGLRSLLETAPRGGRRVVLVGPRLATQHPTDSVVGGAQVAASAVDPAALPTDGAQADMLIAELDAFGADVAKVRALGAALGVGRTLVVYDFAPTSTLDALTAEGVGIARAPLSDGALARLVEGGPRPSDAQPDADVAPPAPRFTTVELARLASIDAELPCACPRYLADVVAQLAAFERYSTRCVVDFPDDAQIHGRLARGTGHARSAMEALLEELCAHEGLDPHAAGSHAVVPDAGRK